MDKQDKTKPERCQKMRRLLIKKDLIIAQLQAENRQLREQLQEESYDDYR